MVCYGSCVYSIVCEQGGNELRVRHEVSISESVCVWARVGELSFYSQFHSESHQSWLVNHISHFLYVFVCVQGLFAVDCNVPYMCTCVFAYVNVCMWECVYMREV